MRKKFVLFVLLLLIFTGRAEAAALKYDIAVIGGGCGGCAAAIEAARSGASVAIIEDTDFLGGQMTASAVCTMDDVMRTRTGIYNEFLNNVRQYYSDRGAKTDICLWGSDTIAGEPLVISHILEDMLKASGRVDVYKRASVVVCKRNKKKEPVSVRIETKQGTSEIAADIFIDATECGDFIPLTGAAYRVGASRSFEINRHNLPLRTDVMQDITYVAVIRQYEQLPEELKLTNQTPDYLKYVPKFRSVITRDGNFFPLGAPYNIETHNAYRAIPDISSKYKDKIDMLDKETWQYITHTCINWANDYPGHKFGEAGLPIRYLEDKKFRRQIDIEAMKPTLAFIYYMQSELGMKDWGVDMYQDYSGYYENVDLGVLEPYRDIIRHFPPKPYIRESRRIMGIRTLAAKDILRDEVLRRTLKESESSIALGEYPVDLHGARDTNLLDRDLKERPEDFPSPKDWKGGLFSIPMEVLIPERVDHLLAAEKNISVSRIVNGAIRLHPAVMHTGQACGALAALAVKNKTAPRNILPIEVQMNLLKHGEKLSVRTFEDMPTVSRTYTGIEISQLYGLLEADDEHIFGTDDAMHLVDIVRLMKGIFKCDSPAYTADELMAESTENDCAEYIKLVLGDNAVKYRAAYKHLEGSESILSKAELAATAADLFFIKKLTDAEKMQPAKKRRKQK